MRKPRQYSKSGLYHVVIRGVNKQNIFFEDDDRKLFISLLKKYSKKTGIKVHAYCLMDNHAHLELEDENHSLSLLMQCLCSVYARLFNKKYDRIGHLFQERFASEIIEDESRFITIFRYIIQNPQKANISPADSYKWSSYKSYMHKKTFVYKDFLIEIFGSLKNLYNFLQQETNDQCLEIELRPSERASNYIDKIKSLLKTTNPIIKPDLPLDIIQNKVKILKNAGFSVRTIVRTTGISKYIVQNA